MTGIKVCGITREQDLLVLEPLGVQAVGFIFTESPRRILMGKARELVTAAKRFQPTPPDVWGVFANEPVEMITEYVGFLGLDAVQLHGDFYGDADIRALGKIPVVRGLNFSGLEDISSIEGAFKAGAGYVLLDAPRPHAGVPPGGTGKTVDWKAAKKVASRFRTVLSGGLNYRNVEDAIKTVRPAMVDVSSGVEMAPGIKDAGLLERFVDAVRGID